MADVTVFRNRWYWRDSRVGHAERVWRLSWQPLTRQYRVSTGGLHQSFATLTDALASLRGISAWPSPRGQGLDTDGRYYLEFSFRLDVSQLPRPLQIGLGPVPGFGPQHRAKARLQRRLQPQSAVTRNTRLAWVVALVWPPAWRGSWPSCCRAAVAATRLFDRHYVWLFWVNLGVASLLALVIPARSGLVLRMRRGRFGSRLLFKLATHVSASSAWCRAC